MMKIMFGVNLNSFMLPIIDDIMSLMFLYSMLDIWNHVVMIISNAYKCTLKFDDVVSTIISNEIMNKHVENSSTHAVLARDWMVKKILMGCYLNE